MKKKTSAEFVKEARKKHGNLYDYSQTKYIKHNQKLSIICNLHGTFSILPGNHLKGQGCRICGIARFNESRMLSSEDFIDKAKEVHGDRYDYSHTEYKGPKEKVSILCSIHGIFEQNASNHLKGKGCKKCGARYSSQEFIIKANLKHNNKYDYSHVEYKTSQQKVLISCSIHGIFEQTPSAHLKGRECPECGKKKASESRKVGIKRFIERAREIHGDRYDYSISEYTTMHKKIWIICPEHGKFFQKAHNHITGGNGCPDCKNDKLRENFAFSQTHFIELLKDVHGSSINYDKVIYKNSHTKIDLVCPLHGSFECLPIHALRGTGCAKCSKKKAADKLKMSVEDFIYKASEIHQNRYSYEKVNFKNLRESIKIKCKKHGYFDQVAFGHMTGTGCPKCKSSRGENKIINWLIKNKISYIHQWTDHDCIINVGKAKFDFFLPDLNFIIEYDGEQHFKPIKFGASISDKDADENLMSLQIADFIKNEWAELNKIKLHRIKYDEDVSKSLEELFKFLA